jgi:hypothetical protein
VEAGAEVGAVTSLVPGIEDAGEVGLEARGVVVGSVFAVEGAVVEWSDIEVAMGERVFELGSEVVTGAA